MGIFVLVWTRIKTTNMGKTGMYINRKFHIAIACLESMNANQGESITLKEISQHLSLSTSYLEQIYHLLKTAGIVKSHLGRAGGYHLTRPLNEISLEDIYKALFIKQHFAGIPSAEKRGGKIPLHNIASRLTKTLGSITVDTVNDDNGNQ